MPRGGFTNPAPKTESAREARKSFFCELCQKGYARMNEYEAHQSSYDHQHKKRLKEMKQMQRDPMASTKARKAERKADEKSGLITIKPVKLDGGTGSPAAAAGGGFKKGGFKSAFAEPTAAPVKNEGEEGSAAPGIKRLVAASDGLRKGSYEESDTEDEGYEMYDPRRPTD